MKNSTNVFYKYLNVEGLLATLKHTSRKWSSPRVFGDLFDNQINLIHDEADGIDTLREILIKFEIVKKGNNILSKINLRPPAKVVEQLNQMYKNHFDDTSIFCIAKSPNIITMWDYYAETSKGGVIMLKGLKEVNSPLQHAQSVHYYEKMPKLDFIKLLFNANQTQSIQLLHNHYTLSKYIDYAHEREYRVITTMRNTQNDYEIIPFAKEEIGGLYLGYRMNTEIKRQIITLMNKKYPWASIFQCHPKKYEYGYDFESIK